MISNTARLTEIIRSLVQTEKSTDLAEKTNTYTFKVLPNAKKPEIKESIETLFNVKVKKVRTLNMQGKLRRTNHGMGKRSDWKKAYVTLEQGQSLSDVIPEENQ